MDCLLNKRGGENMIDLNTYYKQKLLNLVTLVKAGGNYVASSKRYDPATAAVLPEEVTSTTLQEMLDRKKELEDQLIIVNKFIAELQVL